MKGVERRASSIRILFQWEGERCRETLLTNGKPMPPTARNLAFAESLVAEIRDRIRLGTFRYAEYFGPGEASSTGAGVTLGEQLDAWLAAQRVEHSTRAGYASGIRFWKDALGGILLPRLTHTMILTALAARPNLSGKTINNYSNVLRAALALALREKLIPEDPSAGLPRAVWQRKPADPFSLEEAEKIISSVAPEIRDMVEFWFFTGLRTSELAGLHWASVDLAGGYVRIDEALVRGRAKNKTKTGVSRDVLLNSRALAALTRQRARTALAGEFVWLDPRYGTPWTDERAFRRSYWTPTLKRLGIRYRRPYNCRHTYATMLLMAPEFNAAWSAGQMGHSIEVFLGTYAKWIHGAQDKRQLDALEGWLLRSGT